MERAAVTFDDDYLRLELLSGQVNIPLAKVGFEWPPPERIVIDSELMLRAATDEDDSGILNRVSYSAITDDQRADMSNVCRGALYRYAMTQ